MESGPIFVRTTVAGNQQLRDREKTGDARKKTAAGSPPLFCVCLNAAPVRATLIFKRTGYWS